MVPLVQVLAKTFVQRQPVSSRAGRTEPTTTVFHSLHDPPRIGDNLSLGSKTCARCRSASGPPSRPPAIAAFQRLARSAWQSFLLERSRLVVNCSPDSAEKPAGMPQMANAREETIGFEHKGVGAVLAHNRVVVPLNQREYSWEEEHVRELLHDFANAIANNRATYFLGTIVLTRGEGDVPEVSDGQQRLATTTIPLAANRDYFFRNKDAKRAASIENEYLKTTDIETTETVPKLRLNVDDNEFFTKYITASPDSPD